jgi:hypothetical protein
MEPSREISVPLVMSTSPSSAVTFAVAPLAHALEMDMRMARDNASYRDSVARRFRSGRLGHRTHNRIANNLNVDAGYSTYSDTDTDTEREGDAGWEFTWRSAFTDCAEIEPLWAECCELTEEKQNRLLAPKVKPLVPPAAVGVPPIGRRPLAKDSKRILKKYSGADFFDSLNKELHAFLHHASPGPAAAASGKKGSGLSYVLLMTHMSDLYGVAAAGGHLEFTFRDSYHRKILHALCEYYSLVSRSKTLDSGERVTVIKRPRRPLVLPCLRLEDLQ